MERDRILCTGNITSGNMRNRRRSDRSGPGQNSADEIEEPKGEKGQNMEKQLHSLRVGEAGKLYLDGMQLKGIEFFAINKAESKPGDVEVTLTLRACLSEEPAQDHGQEL